MKTKVTSIIIGLVIVVGTGSLVYLTKKPMVVVPTENPVATTTNPDVPVTPTPKPTPAPKPSGISLAQIAQHSSRSSCWSAINGGVYDLTSWIPNHPGGEQKILSLCGIDGSNSYNGKHGGEAKQARILAGFKIGALAK